MMKKAYPTQDFAREVAELQVTTGRELLILMQWSARLASLPDATASDRDHLTRWRDLPRRISADLEKLLANRCQEGVWNLRHAIGEDLALSVIDAQDFYCFYKSSEMDVLPAKARASLEAWFDEAEDTALDYEAVETLELFIERFPISEEFRLGIVNAPMSPFMLGVLASRDKPPPPIRTEWPPSRVAVPEELLFVDDGGPSHRLQEQAERLDAEYDVPDTGTIFVSRRLNPEWGLVLDIWGPNDRELPVRSVRLGLIPGQLMEAAHTVRWLVDLRWVPAAQRLAALRKSITITFQNGGRLEIREPAKDPEIHEPAENIEDDWICENSEAAFAMEAKSAESGDVQHERRRPPFVPLGHVLIDGAEREVFTDRRRVAIRLKPREIRAGVQIDGLLVKIQASAGAQLGVLIEYGWAQAAQLLSEEKASPGKHILHWC